MHGLVIRSFEGFVRNTYGDPLWGELVLALDEGIESFEPMFHYDDALAWRLLRQAAQRLGKPDEALLEDFGTYLVAHPASQRVRRLLRFGGADFEEFLLSLEDLSGRARLAVPDLDLPPLILDEFGAGEYGLRSQNAPPEVGPVLCGLLRAMADDYGALVLIEVAEGKSDDVALTIRLLEAAFSQDRGFALAQRATG